MKIISDTGKRRILSEPSFRFLLITVLASFLYFSQPVKAEADAYQMVMNLEQIGFGSGGGAFLNPVVLGAMRNGQFSPIMQFVLMNHMMNECIEATLKDPYVPLIRDPYLVAKRKFDYGICRIKKCWQNGMLMQMLPMLSSGSDKESGSQQMAVLLTQAFQEDQACDGSDNGGFDPQMLMMLLGSNK